MAHNKNPVPAPGFEGCEKKLVIYFAQSADMRQVTRESWDAILTDARCTIINSTCNEHFDSYVLSESSLFVFQHKILIKTCGTTRLLNCVPRLLRAAKEIGTEPEFVQFSRSNFIFPANQPYPHRNFALEVEYLNTFFPGGHAYILGPINGPRWHVYTCDLLSQGKAGAQDQTFEIAMFDLDRNVMRQFYRSATDPNNAENKDGFAYPQSGVEATIMSGIDKLMPGATIDDFLFTPCGYSCNALKDDVYFTIHITPEPQCSFVSFETNLKVPSYNELLRKVLDTFKPGNYVAAAFIGVNAEAATISPSMPWNMDGYTTKGRTKHHFEHHYDVSCTQAVKDNANLPICRSPSSYANLDNVSTEDRSISDHFDNDLHYDDDRLDVAASYMLAKQLDEYQLKSLVLAAMKTQVNIDVVDGELAAQGEGAIVRAMIEKENLEEAFSIVNIDQVVSRFVQWHTHFPQVHPYFAANNWYPGDMGLLIALKAMGCGFSANSLSEMQSLIAAGVPGSRMVVSNLWKSNAQLQLARRCGVNVLAFDNVAELRKIRNHHPQAALLLHLAVEPRSQSQSSSRLLSAANVASSKSTGACLSDVPEILAEVKASGLKLVGVSFDLSSLKSQNSNNNNSNKKNNNSSAMHHSQSSNNLVGGHTDTKLSARFSTALKKVSRVFQQAQSVLGYTLSVIEMGDGFPMAEDVVVVGDESNRNNNHHVVQSTIHANLAHLAQVVQKVVDTEFAADVRVLARPSRFLMASAQTVAVSVVDRRKIAHSPAASPCASPRMEQAPHHRLHDMSATESDPEDEVKGMGSGASTASDVDPAVLSDEEFSSRRRHHHHHHDDSNLANDTNDNNNNHLHNNNNDNDNTHSNKNNHKDSNDSDHIPSFIEYQYYINEGTYGTFYNLRSDSIKLKPVTACTDKQIIARQVPCSVFGVHADDVDCLAEREILPELNIGDWLCFNPASATRSSVTLHACDVPAVRYVCSP